MADRLIYSIAESPAHPDLHGFYQKLGFDEQRFSTTRKAIQGLKKQIPDAIVADFIYGYGNNYAGVNICNLDVFMYTVAKYTDSIPLVLFAEKAEVQFVERFAELFQVTALLTYPVNPAQLDIVFKEDIQF